MSAALRVDGVLQLDHAVQHAADALLVGAWFAQLLDTRIRYAQGRQAAVVVHGHRVVDAQGQHGLGLNVDVVLIEAGIDEYRCQLFAVAGADGCLDIQRDRQGFGVFQADRRDRHLAVAAWLQGQDPASAGAWCIADAAQAIDLAAAKHLEVFIQRAQVGSAEAGRVGRLQRQHHGFALAQASAVDAGEKGFCMGLPREQ